MASMILLWVYSTLNSRSGIVPVNLMLGFMGMNNNAFVRITTPHCLLVLPKSLILRSTHAECIFLFLFSFSFSGSFCSLFPFSFLLFHFTPFFSFFVLPSPIFSYNTNTNDIMIHIYVLQRCRNPRDVRGHGLALAIGFILVMQCLHRCKHL